MTNSIDGLKVGDARVFVAAARTGSLAAAARELGIPKASAGKAVTRVEACFGRQLLLRRRNGYVTNPEEATTVAQLHSWVNTMQIAAAKAAPASAVTIAAPSYLGAYVLPEISAAVAPVRVRAFEAGISAIRLLATDGLLDVAVLPAGNSLPESWATEEIGTLRLELFGPPELAARIGRKPTEKTLAGFPFITPVYLRGGELLAGKDQCPLPEHARTRGHECATIGLALRIAARSGQLVYGPAIAARDLVRRRELVPIDAPNLVVEEPILLAVQVDRVTRRIREAAHVALSRCLADA